MRFVKLPVIALCASLVACGGGGSTPSAIDVSGNYSGAANDSQYGNVQLSLSISESDTQLTGNFNETAQGAVVASGTLSGTISGSTVTATIQPLATGGCPLALTATTPSGKTLSGSYAASGCATADSGTFSVSR